MAEGDLPGLIRSFERHLRAANRSPRTIEKYTLAARQLVTFIAEADGPVDVADVKRRDIEAYISFLLERYKPGHRPHPLPGPPAVLQVVRRGGGDRRLPHGEDGPARCCPRCPSRSSPTTSSGRCSRRAPARTFDDLRDQAILRLLDRHRHPPRRAAPASRSPTSTSTRTTSSLVMGKGRRPRSVPVRRQDRPRARPLPPRPAPTTRRAALPNAVAHSLRRDDRQRHPTDGASAAAPRRASRGCTPTSFDTGSRTRGSTPAATRAT